MLDITFIRNNPDAVKKGVAAKNMEPRLVDDFLQYDAEWREQTTHVEELRARQKKLGAERKVEEAKQVKEELQKAEETLKATEAQRENTLRQIPNIPLADVIVGANDAENAVLREVGKKPAFDFTPKDYLTLSEALDIIDVERAAKVSGARFGYFKREAALLEFALVQYAFATLNKEQFVPVVPPVMVREEMMRGMGYLDRHEDQEETYHFEKDNMYLVGTSEQSVGPMLSGEMLEEKELPKRFVAFSTCFRREAGSYGKDTRGILRVHQFDKVEMFVFCRPDQSESEHQLLLAMEERLMQGLGLPYHVLAICTGDLGTPAAKKYDIEAWMPGQNGGKGEYRETHSTSNTTDFQTRRLNIRFRSAAAGAQKPEYAHALNGTAFAIGRMLIAIIENYQQKDGSIRIPAALVPFMGGITEIRR